jgi:DNA-binding CsgD family transcriptional regulator
MMEHKELDYSLLVEFFNKFSGSDFREIKDNDPLLNEINQHLETNNQIFYIADAIMLDILYISKRVNVMFGVEPEKVSLGYFLTTTQPDDQKRHRLSRSKLFNIAQDLYIQKKGVQIISTNFRAKKPDGSCTNLLYQCYIFYSQVPYESAFLILVITDISHFCHIHKGFHHYVGNDVNIFRCPDDDLLMLGNNYSHTEFAIIEFIDQGLSTKDIAEKLFRSPFTINTHRTNILKKSGKISMNEVINELKAKGLL